MSDLTYEDFKSRLSIKTVLEDAGYQFSRRDGLRYPAYIRFDSNGKRIHGDKFIVTANGLCCFQPPEKRNYNVISFIKEHPELFSDYTGGMDKNRLVNLVCNRLLNNPVTCKQYDIKEERPVQVFDESKYELQRYDTQDWECRKRFYPFFKERGIDLKTQAAFADNFVLSKNIGREDGREFINLGFPFRIPNSGGQLVGLEERGRAATGYPTHKGKATGTNSVDGLWFANLSGVSLNKAERVLWFESGYDAMAFYQIHREKGEDTKGVYASTGGSPSNKQFAGLIAACPEAVHHLCFDRDRAGQMYACTFATVKAEKDFSSYGMKNGTIVFVDKSSGYDRHEMTIDEFSFENFCQLFGLTDSRIVHHPAAEGYKDWNDQLLDKRMEVGDKEYMVVEKKMWKEEPGEEREEKQEEEEGREEKKSGGFRR